jgi:NitT/TauT family transport system ATP-binding protein
VEDVVTAEKPVLAARMVTMSLGGSPVLKECHLDIDRGEVVALVGPSGVGKTTLLQILAGLLAPDEGEVYLHEHPVRRPSQDVAVVFQDYGLLPWRTAARNVALPMEVSRVPRGERRRRALAALKLVGLEADADKFPHQLSGGMRQRTALARAMVGEPSVLLLDEPMSALDVVTKRSMQRQLNRMVRDFGLTTLIVTHDLMDAVRIADRVLIMIGQPGRILAEHRLHRELPEARAAEELHQAVEKAVAEDATSLASLVLPEDEAWTLA